jgi:hypothetical protein
MVGPVQASLLAVALFIAGGIFEAAGQEPGPPHSIPTEMIVFAAGQFEAVPAPAIAGAVEEATCRTLIFEKPEPGFPYAGLELCEVGAVCAGLAFPIWFDDQGNLGFGPDSAERLVAMFCSDQISDPARRAELVREEQERMP